MSARSTSGLPRGRVLSQVGCSSRVCARFGGAFSRAGGLSCPAVLFSIWFRASSESSPSLYRAFRFGGNPNVWRIACTLVLALLYDIHGNLPALEAVLADAQDADALRAGRRLRDRRRLAAGDRRAAQASSRTPPGSAATPTAGSWTGTTRPRRSTPSPSAPLSCSATSWSSELSTLPESTDDRRHALLPRLAALGHGELPAETGRARRGAARRRRGAARRVRPHAPRVPAHGPARHRAASTPAASGCRGTATTAPPTRVIDDDRVEQRRVDYDWQTAVAAVRELGGRAARTPHGAGPVRRWH